MVPRFLEMRGQLKRLIHYATKSPRKIPSLTRLLVRTKILSASRLPAPERDVPLPPLVTVQVNYRCNLRCIQCGEWGREGAYRTLDPNRLRQEMTLDDYERLLDQFTAWRPYLYFFGGEPFLRPDMAALIRGASSRGLLTAVSTNATLIDDERAEQIVDCGLDYFIASLDGPDNVNDAIRGPGVFNKVMRGVRALVAARARERSSLPIIEICMTITSENQRQVLETARLADSLGADVFAVQLGCFASLYQIERTSERFRRTFGMEPKFWSGFLRDTSGIRGPEIARQLRSVESGGYRFRLKRYPKLPLSDSEIDAYFRLPDAVFGRGRCLFPWKRGNIMPNGDVTGCSNFVEFSAGNVRTTPFVEIWNGAHMKRFRESLYRDGLFAACSRCCELYELG